MLGKSASGVPSPQDSSTYHRRVRLRFLFRLRPCWTAFLSILLESGFPLTRSKAERWKQERDRPSALAGVLHYSEWMSGGSRPVRGVSLRGPLLLILM